MKQVLRPDILHQAFWMMATICAEHKVPFGSPEALQIGQEKMRDALTKVNSSPTFLFGHRTQAMFVGLVAGLGRVRLIKEEDGTACFAGEDENVSIPDYRVVLKDNQQCLIEVKNFHDDDIYQPFTVDTKLMAAWQEYAGLTKATFKIAVFFSRVRHWALLSPKAFQQDRDRYSIVFTDAMKLNEMELLGDVMIGTRTPLRLQLRVEKTNSRPIRPGEEEFEGRIVEAALYCQESRITDPTEQTIAFMLMMFGKWNLENFAKLDEPGMVTITYEARPEEEVENQEFQVCDYLSGLFARWYLGATTDEDGKLPKQIYAKWKPGQLGRLIPDNYKGAALPLWLFHLRPNYPAK